MPFTSTVVNLYLRGKASQNGKNMSQDDLILRGTSYQVQTIQSVLFDRTFCRVHDDCNLSTEPVFTFSRRHSRKQASLMEVFCTEIESLEIDH